MDAARLFGTVALAIALTACATLPTTPGIRADSMDFARGCWVEKDTPGGPARAFLRLLPDPADPLVLRGDVVSVRQDWTPIASLAFARDMSWARFEYRFAASRPKLYGPSRYKLRVRADAPEPDTYAVFSATPGSGNRLIVKHESNTGRLGITMDHAGGGGSGVFNGERDGCD